MVPSPSPSENSARDNKAAQRNTRQKAAIREVFLATDRPMGPQEVLTEAAKLISGLGIATVYRNIKALVEEGWLAVVDLPGEPSRYEVAGKAHHHHFHCRACDKVFELPGCSLAIKPNLPKGFVSTSHEIVLYGTCAACGANPSRRN
jgi:Fur family ferric uptake transcriptional regulator